MLRVDNLCVSYKKRGKTFLSPNRSALVVRNISLSLNSGGSLGIIGKSGCGKSTLVRAIAGLVPYQVGTVDFSLANGAQSDSETKRRPRIQMVFQDPVNSLDPKVCILESVMEPLRLFSPKSALVARTKIAEEILLKVGLHSEHWKKRPSALSGGQCQRVAIARALIADPDMLIFDEPTSALDMSIRSQVLNLIVEIKQEQNFSMMYVSHDITSVWYTCDLLAVMHEGSIVEYGACEKVINSPKHHATKTLISSSSPQFDA